MLNLFTGLALKPPTPDQFNYLKEYLSVMAPISSYLDVMQGEENTHLGCVLPILVKLRTKLRGLYLTNQTSKNLRDGLLTKLGNRFGHLFDNESHVIAAIVHPKFKLNWLYFDQVKAERYTDLVQNLIDAGNVNDVDVSPDFFLQQNLQGTPLDSPVEELLQFPSTQSKTIGELVQYLSDPRQDLKMLDNYPSVRKLFIKFNTPIPSSAPVERLFSTANIILTSRRNQLSDLYFEHVLLLKIFFMRTNFMYAS